MANQDFTSTTSNDFGTSGNWTTAVPVAGDNVTFTQSNAVSMDGTDQNAINLASLGVGTEYTGNIGSSGSYFIISADAVTIAGGVGMGNIYLDSGGTDELDNVVIDSASTTKAVYLKGNLGDLIVKHGVVYLVSGSVDNIYVEWDGLGTPPVIVNQGMTVTLFDGTTGFTGTQTGGTITTFQADAGTMDAEGGTVTNIELRGSSRLNHKTTATVASLVVKNGATFDASGDPRAKTITLARLHQGGTIDLDTGLENVTVTSWTEVGDSQIKFPT